MKRATGTRFGPQNLTAFAVMLVILAGCEEGFQLQPADAEDETAETTETSDAVELFPNTNSGNQRDVEAPEVFQVSEAGLWDGRPSLGGIWVAHPDVNQPERVLIKNPSNNKSVTGALFRRERNLPGPALQVSSAAADKLGMTAGSPTRVEVVALRREAVKPPEPAPAEEAKPEEPEIAAAEPAETTAPEAEEKPAKRKWWQKKPEAEVAAAAAVAAATTDTAAEAAEPVVEAAAPEPAAAPAALSDPEVTAPAEKTAKRKWWQKKDANEITETPLDPIAGAAAAIDAAEPTAAETAAAQREQVTAAAAAASAPAVPLSKPFVQVGTFGVAANAEAAASKVRRNGMTAQVRELKTEDNTVWRVLVGPAQNRAERKAMLDDVKDLGFKDAFTAKN